MQHFHGKNIHESMILYVFDMHTWTIFNDSSNNTICRPRASKAHWRIRGTSTFKIRNRARARLICLRARFFKRKRRAPRSAAPSAIMLVSSAGAAYIPVDCSTIDALFMLILLLLCHATACKHWQIREIFWLKEGVNAIKILLARKGCVSWLQLFEDEF